MYDRLLGHHVVQCVLSQGFHLQGVVLGQLLCLRLATVPVVLLGLPLMLGTC